MKVGWIGDGWMDGDRYIYKYLVFIYVINNYICNNMLLHNTTY